MLEIRNLIVGTGCVLLLVLFSCCSSNERSQSQPNIIWLVTEDNSIHFSKLYNPHGASMPNIEKLAMNGVVFNHAFSNAPVCSVARSTLISGCYAPRTGTQYHRKMEMVPMPEGLKMFPYYLKNAGYYTTNNSKEDYNFVKSEYTWDESSEKASYKNRTPGQPFFHIQNFGVTHEGQLHFPVADIFNMPTRTNIDSISIFPYHPDTETFRYSYARSMDNHVTADEQMGAFIKEIADADLLEDTFIFYFGDHGGVLPGSKGYVYESGLHVPLVVYVPSKWKYLVPFESGSRTDAFVQFVDFAPTVLNLAGIEIPAQMDGQPFLGKNLKKTEIEKRNIAFSYADRFDEKYDFVRSIRKGKFKYIRNYQPFNIDALFNFYRYKMLAFQEWRSLYEQDKLDDKQRLFFEPRSAESLYDLENDPHEVHDLSSNPEYGIILKELRSELKNHVLEMPDLGFFPESYFLENGLSNPVQFGRDHKSDIAELCELADAQLLPFNTAKKVIREALQSTDPWKRYWALIDCTSFGKEASEFIVLAGQLAKLDQEKLVRIRAVEFLVFVDQLTEEDLIIEIIESATSASQANLMLNSIALLETMKPNFNITLPIDMFDPSWVAKEGDLVKRRLDFINNLR